MAAEEKFYNGVGENNVGILEVAVDGFSVTPNDAADLTYISRAIYIGGDGNIKLTTKEGTTLTFVGLTAGTILPVRASRIFSTDTTATNLIGLL